MFFNNFNLKQIILRVILQEQIYHEHKIFSG